MMMGRDVLSIGRAPESSGASPGQRLGEQARSQALLAGWAAAQLCF